jgi:hypothetical protein
LNTDHIITIIIELRRRSSEAGRGRFLLRCEDLAGRARNEKHGFAELDNRIPHTCTRQVSSPRALRSSKAGPGTMHLRVEFICVLLFQQHLGQSWFLKGYSATGLFCIPCLSSVNYFKRTSQRNRKRNRGTEKKRREKTTPVKRCVWFGRSLDLTSSLVRRERERERER